MSRTTLDVPRRPARGLVPLTLAAMLTSGSAGCGGSDRGTSVPLTTVCVPLGFGSVQFELVCPAGSGGADHQCTFSLSSSNAGVVAISPSVVVLQENTTQQVFVTTIGNTTGTSTLSGDSDNGPPFTIGTLRVGAGC